MKTILVILSSVMMAAVHSKELLGSHSNQFPIVKGMGGSKDFLLPDFPFGKLGIGLKLDGDLYAGY